MFFGGKNNLSLNVHVIYTVIIKVLPATGCRSCLHSTQLPIEEQRNKEKFLFIQFNNSLTHLTT